MLIFFTFFFFMEIQFNFSYLLQSTSECIFYSKSSMMQRKNERKNERKKKEKERQKERKTEKRIKNIEPFYLKLVELVFNILIFEMVKV